MKLARLSVALCVISLITPLASADADYSTPKNAYITYTKAIADGDIQVLKNSALTTPKHEQFLESHLKYLAGEKLFREACIKSFPTAAKDLADPTQQALNAIAKAEVKIDGDSATLQTRESTIPVMLKKVETRWKVDLVQMLDASELDGVVQYRNAAAYVMNEMREDINNGKYKTFDEVRSTLDVRVQMRMALPQGEEPATQPSAEADH